MKKIRRQMKKLLSLILSMAMLMTMLITFDVGVLSASAADSLPFSLSGDSLGTAGNICVYVPETIYLNPIASPDGYSFQYFADRENTPDGNLIAVPDKTSGNVFIYIPQADRITDVQAVGSGMTAVIGQTSTESGVNTVSTTVTGYSSGYASGVLNWTVSYVDAETDEVNTINTSSYVFAPNVNPDNSVISVTINPGAAKSLSNKDGYLCSTAWITGAHRIISSCYGISSDRDGILSAGGEDVTGSYMNNFLLNPSYTVPAADYRSVSVYNTNGIGGSGYWSTDDDVHFLYGGMGEINIDSSRYTNLGQIPDLFTGVDCNGVYESPATVSLDYGWYSDCAGNLYNVNNCAVSSQDVQNGSYAVINGQRFTGFNGACFAPYLTTTKTLIVKQTNSYRMRGSISSSSKNVTGEGLCYLKCKFYDKSEIRNVYNLIISYSDFLQPEFFESDVWSQFSALHSRIGEVLGQPDLDMSTFSNEELAEYYNLASAMVACKAAEAEEGTTVYFTDYSGNAQTVYKSDYILTDSIPADYSAVNGALLAIEIEYLEELYTRQSWAALVAAVNAVVYGLDITHQAEVDAMADEIRNAKNALKRIANYYSLNQAVDRANHLNPEKFTEETWAAVEAALAAVVYDLDDTHQGEVNEMANEINRAIDALVAFADYSAVRVAVKRAENRNPDRFTEESWAAVEAALAAVVYKLDYTHQDEVDEMADEINAAIDGLVCKIISGEGSYILSSATLTATPVIRTAGKMSGYGDYKVGSTIVQATPSGVPYISGNYANEAYSGETPEWPTVTFESDFSLANDRDSVTLETNISGAQIEVSNPTDTKWVWTIKGGTITAGTFADFTVSYSYTYTDSLTGKTVTKDYKAYASSYVDNVIQPAGMYISSDRKWAFHSYNKCEAVVRILGQNTKGSYYPAGEDMGSDEWAHGVYDFQTKSAVGWNNTAAAYPNGGTVLYKSEKKTDGNITTNKTLDRQRPVSSTYIDTSMGTALDSENINLRYSAFFFDVHSEEYDAYVCGTTVLSGEQEYSTSNTEDTAAARELVFDLPHLSASYAYTCAGKDKPVVYNTSNPYAVFNSADPGKVLALNIPFRGTGYASSPNLETLADGNKLVKYTFVNAPAQRYYATNNGQMLAVNNAVNINLYLYNKAELRSAIENAAYNESQIPVSPTGYEIGVNPQEWYYDNSDESYDTFLAALKNALHINAKYDTNQNDIDAAADALNEAAADLKVATADYTAANEALARYNSLNAEDYTAESWAAVEAAKAALGDMDYTIFYQPLVDDLTAEFVAAMDALEVMAHTHTFYHIVVPSSCTVNGIEYDICLSCGQTFNAVVIPMSHRFTHVIEDSTCTAEGREYDICSVCGEIANETVIPVKEHTFGDWVRTLDPTTTEEGVEERECIFCGYKETRAVDKLNLITDETTGVSVIFDDDFDEGVELEVSEVLDGSSFQLINFEYSGNVNCMIFDINPTIGGEKVQPTGAVTVRIPVPEGFNGTTIFVVYVNSETGTVETIPCTIADGYVVFRTTHFSHYAICQLISAVRKVKLSDLSLKLNSEKTLSPKITADDGVSYTVRYESYDPSIADVDRNGTVHALKNGKTAIRCVVTDEYGNTESDICNVTVRTPFIQWIIRIFFFGFLWMK